MDDLYAGIALASSFIMVLAFVATISMCILSVLRLFGEITICSPYKLPGIMVIISLVIWGIVVAIPWGK